MTTYYISKSGSDSNNGLGPDASHATNKPWLTIGKALLAGGLASGDTAYIAPGTYRESVTIGITNPTAETKIIGDPHNAQGFKDGSGNPVIAGYIVWTGYTTNDRTTPNAATTCLVGTRDFLTFENIIFVGGDLASYSTLFTNIGATNLTLRRCIFFGGRSGTCLSISALGSANAGILIENCVSMAFTGAGAIRFDLPTVTGADYDAGITIRNCLFVGGNNTAAFTISATGALANKGGGVDIRNCTILGGNIGITASSNVSATIPVKVYNCLIWSNQPFQAALTDNIVEDWNLLIGGSLLQTGITTPGANSQGTPSTLEYAPLFEIGQSFLYGFRPRPFLAPMLESGALGFGNQAGSPTTDFLGNPRPSGGAPTWGNALPGVGYMERPNTAVRETATVRTGANALKILGPGLQDFDVPVDAAATTITVYGRYDSNYAGTLPQMIVLNGEECGVATATDTVTVAANTWEQLSLTFTPVRQGIVTVRLQSNSTAGNGSAFFDDFAAA